MQPHRYRCAPCTYATIQGKGATLFGVGGVLARVAQVIQGDERALITCSM